jgi:hypothetical protein
MHTRQDVRKQKRIKGAALAECAVGLILLSGLIVGGLMLLFDCGAMFYSKIKLAGAAQSAANYAVASSEWLGARRPNMDNAALVRDVTAITNVSLKQMGLPPAREVRITRFTEEGKRFVRVTIKGGRVQLISNGLLPSSINLDETACAAFGNTAPVGVLGMTVGESPNGKGFYIPIYGAGASTPGPSSFPDGNFPYWHVGVQSESSNHALGPYQNRQSGGDYRSYTGD